MDSALTTVGLPLALVVVMLGLGLGLTPDDFRRTARQPRAVAAALGAQLLVLPAVAFALVLAFDPDPAIAVGMMLLAASPGGTTANLFSHLFRGDVALNISLTAINSVVAVITLPVVVNLAVAYFDPTGTAGQVGLQFTKTAEVFAVVLVPVAIGMLVRAKSPGFAERADRPVRGLSAIVLAVVIVGALVAERAEIANYLVEVGAMTVIFCVISLSVGYLLPHLVGVTEKQALASAFEVGVHNSTLAIAVAISVLDDKQLAIPAAVYGIAMFPLAALTGVILTRRRVRVASPDEMTARRQPQSATSGDSDII